MTDKSDSKKATSITGRIKVQNSVTRAIVVNTTVKPSTPIPVFTSGSGTVVKPAPADKATLKK